MNSPRYDEIIQELSSKQEPSTSETKNEPTEEFLSANIKQIKEILLVHDDRSGSATMGMTVLKDILDKNHLTIPLRKVNIHELKGEPDSLIVAKESLAEKHRWLHRNPFIYRLIAWSTHKNLNQLHNI